MKPLRKLSLLVLVALIIVVTAAAAGVWYYRSQCHGIDDCAAAAAESHERDSMSEPR